MILLTSNIIKAHFKKSILKNCNTEKNLNTNFLLVISLNRLTSFWSPNHNTTLSGKYLCNIYRHWQNALSINNQRRHHFKVQLGSFQREHSKLCNNQVTSVHVHISVACHNRINLQTTYFLIFSISFFAKTMFILCIEYIFWNKAF